MLLFSPRLDKFAYRYPVGPTPVCCPYMDVPLPLPHPHRVWVIVPLNLQIVSLTFTVRVLGQYLSIAHLYSIMLFSHTKVTI